MKITPSWLSEPRLQALISAFEAAGLRAEIRAVGGCVRDAVRNVSVGDINDVDIATTLTPDRVDEIVRAAGFRTEPTGLQHGTVTAIVRGEPFEITTLRRDVDTDGRHADVEFTTSWEIDAQRRDFTINALYMDADGEVYDPTGRGIADIEAYRLVFVGSAKDRIQEDYLRILRLFRFQARFGYSFDYETMNAVRDYAHGLANISGERIAQEMRKLLMSREADQAWLLMEETGVIQAIVGRTRWTHDCLKAVIAHPRANEMDFPARLAVVAGFDTESFCQRMKLSNDEKAVARIVATATETEARADRHATRLMSYRVGVDNARKVIIASSVISGHRDIADQLVWANDRPVFPVKGQDLLDSGLTPGPEMGRVLKEVEAKWIEADFPDRATALAMVDHQVV